MIRIKKLLGLFMEISSFLQLIYSKNIIVNIGNFLPRSPPLHLVFGMALDHLPLDLELDLRNRLVHLGHQQYIALRNTQILHHFGLVRLAR